MHPSLLSLRFVPQVCFDEVCQRNADQVFLFAISLPALVGLAVLAYTLRPVPKDLLESGRIFEDPVTGTVFEAQDGVRPERDKQGQLAFRAVSFTPWPITENTPGERLRVKVGPVRDRKPQTYVFDKVLPGPSEIIEVTLPRPMGIVLEEDPCTKRAVVRDILENGNAWQRMRLAQFDVSRRKDAALPGDVVRGFTATNLVYPTKSLFGMRPPQRHVVVYGADGQRWPRVAAAFKAGLADDGPVTVILERPLPRGEK